MAKKLVSFDEEAEGTGLPQVVEERLETHLGQTPPSIDDLGAATETVTIDPGTAGGIKSLTLTGNAQLSLSPSTAGAVLTLVITQGGGAHEIAWPSNVAWQSGQAPILSPTEGRVDVITLLCTNGLAWLGFVSGTDIVVPLRTVTDSFDRADASSLGMTDTGQMWQGVGWAIQGGMAQATDIGLVESHVYVDVGEADKLHASVVAPTGGVDASVGLRIGVRQTGAGESFYRVVWTGLSQASAYIQRREAGADTTLLGNFSLGAAVGDRIGLMCEVENGTATLTVTRNGTAVVTTTDPTPIPAGTLVSLTNVGATGLAKVDDFRVEFL